MQTFNETKTKIMTNDSLKEKVVVLSDRDHVRLRTNVYLGTMEPTTFDVPIFGNGQFQIKKFTFIPAVYKAVGEILDNSLDEFTKITQRDKTLIIDGESNVGLFRIADNGRGIPIGKHHQLKDKYIPEVALGMLRSGRNFDEKNNEVGVIGMNGFGSVCTNYCSSFFNIRICQGSKIYEQKFIDGAGKITSPRITKIVGTHSESGTDISFQLDNNVFKDVVISPELMRNRAIEIAINRPDISVVHKGEKFRYKKGFEELLKTFSSNYFKFENESMQFYVVLDCHQGNDEAIFTWVNNSFLFDGGICNTQFKNVLVSSVLDQLSAQAKKKKCAILKDDIVKNLLVFGFIKIANPKYDSQAKTRLTGPNLRNEISELMINNWDTFAKKNKQWLEVVFDRAYRRHHKEADDDATKEHMKKCNKKIEGLLDANPPDKDRSKCVLYIMEGDSAKSSIVEVRDPTTVASYSLGGKINNTYDATVAQVLKMQKLTDLLASIGLTPGKKAERSSLRYGKVVISTDADHDGSDIFTLLVCLFYKFWPELFDKKQKPFIHRLLAPNVVMSKATKRIHFADRNTFEQKKEKYKGYSVEYMKGLGSMQQQDWEMIVNGNSDEVLIPIQDIDGMMEPTLYLLFGNDADMRKDWLRSKNN